MPLLPRLLFALALLLPLHAPASEDAAAEAAPAATVEPEAADAMPRPPLPERSQAQAQALGQRLPTDEQRQLEVGDEAALALWRPVERETPRGLVLLLPGEGEHADWPKVIGPLRRRLAEHGWATLSLTLPDPLTDLPPRRARARAEPTVQPTTAAPVEEPVDKAPEPTPAEPEALAEEDAQRSAERNEAPPKKPPRPLAERVQARVEAALALPEVRQAERLVLIGHGSGAYWAARQIVERRPEAVHGLLLIEAREPVQAEPPLHTLLAALSLPTGDFFDSGRNGAREAARRRGLAARVNEQYRQTPLTGLPLDPAARDERLSRRVRGWLERLP